MLLLYTYMSSFFLNSSCLVLVFALACATTDSPIRQNVAILCNIFRLHIPGDYCLANRSISAVMRICEFWFPHPYCQSRWTQANNMGPLNPLLLQLLKYENIIFSLQKAIVEEEKRCSFSLMFFCLGKPFYRHLLSPPPPFIPSQQKEVALICQSPTTSNLH